MQKSAIKKILNLESFNHKTNLNRIRFLLYNFQRNMQMRKVPSPAYDFRFTD